MKVIAVYYVDPEEGRQKYVIENPAESWIEHYLWLRDELVRRPRGVARVAVLDARMVLPTVTEVRDWYLSRSGVRTIRLEMIEDRPTPVEGDPLGDAA